MDKKVNSKECGKGICERKVGFYSARLSPNYAQYALILHVTYDAMSQAVLQFELQQTEMVQ